MEFEFTCPHCAMAVVAVPEAGGELIRCPSCQGLFAPTATARPPRRVGARGAAPAVRPAQALRFTFACPRCQSVLEALSTQSGGPGRCPTCGAHFAVPAVDRSMGLVRESDLPGDDEAQQPVHAYAAAGAAAPQLRRLADGSQVIVCPRCGRESSIESDVCGGCGLPFTADGVAAVAQARRGDPVARVALVLSILGIVSACFPILGLGGVGLGCWALHRADRAPFATRDRRFAWAAIIAGLVSLLLAVLWYW